MSANAGYVSNTSISQSSHNADLEIQDPIGSLRLAGCFGSPCFLLLRMPRTNVLCSCVACACKNKNVHGCVGVYLPACWRPMATRTMVSNCWGLSSEFEPYSSANAPTSSSSTSIPNLIARAPSHKVQPYDRPRERHVSHCTRTLILPLLSSSLFPHLSPNP